MLSRTQLLLVASLSAGLACAQTELVRGQWRAVLGPTSVESVHFGDRLVFRAGGYAGYLPGWKGTAFTMAGAERKVEGNRATWHKAEEGKQDCTLAFELTEDGAAWSVKSTLFAAGPSEFGIQIDPEFVRSNEHGALAWLDDAIQLLPLGGTTPPHQSVRDRIAFDTPDSRIEIEAPHSQLQDRRAGKQGLYLVRVLSNSGAAPREAEMAFRLVRREAPAEQRAARTQYLAQTPLTDREIPLPNHDFAEGLRGWHAGAFGSAVPDGYQESPAVRIETATAAERNSDVYITRQVPVVEGAEYELSGMLRTRNVRNATAGGMSGTGATLIVEFADKEGKWFAGGSYATGLYGDQDWRRVTAKPARAPKGAGFAILYLAMRATGTAWFDDISLREIRRFPMLLSPLPGAEVADNTPALSWHCDPRETLFLDLSPSADFGAGTLSYPAPAAPSFSLPEPIRPGTWHWRLRSELGTADSAVWSFVQTAPLDQDCTPPSIEPAHAFLPEPRTPVRIPVADNRAVTRAELSVDGRAVTPELAGNEIRWSPDRDWTPGLHRLAVRVFDAVGAMAEETVYCTHARELPKRIWLQERGCLFGDTPEFPLGMYGVRIEDMPEIAKAGFDLVHNYAWDGTGSVESAIEYLDEARRHGLHVFMGLDRRRLMADDFGFVAERVGTLMGHPALYAWYLFDEPDLAHQYLAPERIVRYHQLIARLDPFHPIILTCAGDSAVPRYRDTGTVYWTQVYGDTRFVARRIPKNRQDLRPETAHAAILHCYDRNQSGALKAGGTVDIAAFQPDSATMRANAFMALAHQSSGLLWWWWGQGSRITLTVSGAPQAWQGLQETIAAIRDLRPLLVAEGESRTQILAPKEELEIHVLEKRVGNRVLLIAVNRDKEEVEVDLPLQLVPADATGQVRVGEGPVATRNGRLRHRFAPIGVLVAEWTVGD